MQSSNDSNTFLSEYQVLIPRYQRVVDEVKFALNDALERSELTVSLTGRVKSTASFLEKIDRKQYDDPLRQMTDLAGVRVVCQFTAHLAEVEKALRELFLIHERVNKTALLGPDRMGYFGTHYIVQLAEAHQGPRYDKIRDLKCEVQVKTILHDAWAQIDHSLMYKAESSIPEKERRELNSVSALLEVAQSIFDRTSETRARYVEEVEQKLARPSEFLDQPIDRETLSAYTRRTYPTLPVNRKIQELILEQLDTGRYRTLRDLDQVVLAASDAVDAFKNQAPDLFKAGTDYITKSLGFVDPAFRKRHGFALRTRQAFDSLAPLVNGAQ